MLDGHHKCPVDGCQRLIKDRFAFCHTHWYKLTDDERAAVWRSYHKHGAGTAEHFATLSMMAERIDLRQRRSIG